MTGLHNLYGPTEAAIDVTAWECPRGYRGNNVPIGRPLGNTQIYILDPHSQPVPVGVPGEIHIAGVQVARGYLHRPELTAERFVKDPFARDARARMYKTGDLGRWLSDGTIEYLGRNDQQVKIRGFRIELGEIEAALRKQDDVMEAVVLAREDQPGDKRLAAYYTGKEEIGAEVLRAHLAAKLPDYMVPAVYVYLQAWPLTLNGKLDRKALPAPDGDAYAKQDYEEPQGKMESVLAAIWADVLNVEQVGRHDNFFELGGGSLLAVSLLERMRKRGLIADVRALFAAPTPAGLAEVTREMVEIRL